MASTLSNSVQSGRIRVLKDATGTVDRPVGPVVYWMSRDQRVKDNWALIHAVDEANKANVPVAVAFDLFDQFLGANSRQLGKGADVPEIEWCKPGEKAALEVMMGSKDGFLTKRLKSYANDRNNPLKPKGLSGLSPYLIPEVFLEELIVRRELPDNYCYHQPPYDSLLGALEWARKTLMDHASDKREHVYS
ncbi:Deoxyribodipyrimidine photo-lyase, partial [Cucurbita argyrosperma subsp. argyrosperma]